MNTKTGSSLALYIYYKLNPDFKTFSGSPCSVVAKVLDFAIVVCEFELLSLSD